MTDWQSTTKSQRLYTAKTVSRYLSAVCLSSVSYTHLAFDTYTKNSSGNDVDVTVNFGEYASPSFEATVETVAKARPGKVIMSVEASVDEMYGDSKDEEWKAEEIKRLRIENGVMETQEPVISEFDDLGGTIPVSYTHPFLKVIVRTNKRQWHMRG